MNNFQVKYLKIASKYLDKKLEIVKKSSSTKETLKQEKKGFLNLKKLLHL